MHPAPLPLHGVRVLDLTRLLPGPYAGHVLVGYGADVLKVEDTGGGDYARVSPALPSSGFGAAFTASNAGKRSIAVDLKTEAGRAVFLRLVQDADVLLESFRPGVMQRLGLDYARLSALHPRLIYCAMTGYGQHTRQAALAGHDLNYQGSAGLLDQRTGDAPHELPPALLGDLVGGSYAAVIALLAALLQRQATGQGRFIDISITHGAMALLPMTTIATANGHATAPFGATALTGGNPAYGVYVAQDGRSVCLGALEHKFWKAFCLQTGLDDLADAPPHDPATRPAVRARLAALFLTRPAAEWALLGASWDVCLSEVASVEQALADARAQDLPLFHHYTGPQGHAVQVLKGVTADLAEPARQLSPPPRQGEHTRAVLRAAGYTDAQVAELLAQAAIRCA